MICDEPTGNLDTSTAHSILDLFRKLNEEQGITLVIVTHDDMISNACKRVVRIADGSIVEGAGEFGSRDLGPSKAERSQKAEETERAEATA
jgi:ABC-type lipoprotein export system ATPase subunit